MTDLRWSERSIFEAAIDKGSPEERAAYLDQVCGSNPGLRQEVEALLAAHERLENISVATPSMRRPPSESARLSGRTSSWSRSARAVSASSSWLSRPSRSAARWR